MEQLTAWKPQLRHEIAGMNSVELARFIHAEQQRAAERGTAESVADIYQRLQEETN